MQREWSIAYVLRMPNPVRNGYQDVETLRNAEDVIAVITRRTGSYQHTASFFKVYAREGEEARTSFFSLKALVGLRQMIDTADTRITELEEQAKKEMRR